MRSGESLPAPVHRVTVVGAGYVGLVSAACLASLGHQVWCVDLDAERVARLRAGECPIHEPGLPALLRAGLASGRLRVGTNLAAAVEGAAIVLVCVATPANDDGSADTSFVDAVFDQLRPIVAAGTVIVTKSTVPVGTGDRLAALVADEPIEVASNPEFLREGSAVSDFLEPDRIIIGVAAEQVAEALVSLYAGIDAPVIVTDRRSAELVKYGANAFLGTKLSFMNSMAELCEAVGGDIDAVIQGLGTDPRIGASFLQPGPGFGGSCFPKDMLELGHLGDRHGLPMHVVRAAIEANERQFVRLVDLTARPFGGALTDLRVALLGLAYKAGTDDVRQSPAVRIASGLVGRGARVEAHDPRAAAPSELSSLPGFVQVDTVEDAVAGADVIVAATEWPAYRGLAPARLAELTSARVLIDGRRVWSVDAFVGAGFDVWSVGSGWRLADAGVQGRH